jgi:micrococcal nuclease
MKNKLHLFVGFVVVFLLLLNIAFSVSILAQQGVTKSDIRTLDKRVIALEGNQDEVVLPSKDVIAAKPTPEYDKLIKVSRVVDGDTIQLENGERLRYIGIDTPELYDPRKPVQCFAAEASKKNKELVEGKMVKFNKDVAERDKYGRLLGYVYLEDGKFVNLEMVKQGYAFSYPYPPDISKQEQFNQAEKIARENKLGLWNGCEVTTTASGREETNAVLK